MAMAFQDYFNRAAEQRDRLIDIEQQRVNLGMPSASAPAAQAETPKTGPATDPQTDEQRQFDYGIRNVPATASSPGIDTRFISSLTGRVGGGLKKGIARVPGKGDGTKDTVPAVLAPGEAVLNKAAADKMGRGLIAALNKMGAQKMGLV